MNDHDDGDEAVLDIEQTPRAQFRPNETRCHINLLFVVFHSVRVNDEQRRDQAES